MAWPDRVAHSAEKESTAPAKAGGAGWRRKRSLLLRLVFSVMSLVFALGVAEIALRLCTPMQLGFEYKDGRFTHPAAERNWPTNRMG